MLGAIGLWIVGQPAGGYGSRGGWLWAGGGIRR